MTDDLRYDLVLSEEELRSVNLTLLSGTICTQWQDCVETTGDGDGCRSCRRVTSMPANRLRGPTPDFLSGFTPIAFASPEAPTRQWGYFPIAGAWLRQL